MSIPAATIVADQDQIKPLLGREKSEGVAGTKRYQKNMKWNLEEDVIKTKCEERSDTWNESSQAEREGEMICDLWCAERGRGYFWPLLIICDIIFLEKKQLLLFWSGKIIKIKRPPWDSNPRPQG